MERLTFDGNFCDIAMCGEVPGNSFCEDGSCSQKKVWERLKEYEDAKESGRLFVSPVALGQTVFVIFRGEIVARKIGLFSVTDATAPAIYVALDSDSSSNTVCWDRAFGKFVFLTREDAEAALMEVKNSEKW